MDPRLTPERVFVYELEKLDFLHAQLGAQVYALGPAKNAAPPFTFYIRRSCEEERALDGGTGLQQASFALHLVTARYEDLSVLGDQIRRAILGLRGRRFMLTDGVPAPHEGDADAIFIEDVTILQSSPDLLETEVGLYRRIYDVDIHYQTEEGSV